MKIIDNNHKNQAYCRCSMCAEDGYGGAWVSRNTRSRHMKAERTRQQHKYSESESSNSELTSDNDEHSSASSTEMQILMDRFV